MKVSLVSQTALEEKTDIYAIGVDEKEGAKQKDLVALDRKLGGAIARAFKEEGFSAKVGSGRLIATAGKVPATYILIVGLGSAKTRSLEAFRRAAATLVVQARALNVKKVSLDLLGACEALAVADCVQAAAEGAYLGTYQFDRYKSDRKPLGLRELGIVVPKSSASVREKIKQALETAKALAEACSHARDLVNVPPQDMTPAALARAARTVKGVRVRVLHRAQIEALKMGSFLSVSHGSAQPPVFIEMIYTPRTRAKKILAVVGKGVTFDSGGLSLKPAKSMETMKCDMAGAAAAIAFMQVVGALKPAYEVRAYVAATENMPDGGSTRPGDVVRAMNGKTIEVLNTDAEGRLTLVDALHYALTRKQKPDYVIDMATLTGACLVALGERCTAAMGTDQGLVDKLKAAGDKSGEMIWQLPLIEEYLDDLKSPVADIQNSGGRYAGSIIGGLFLKEFVGDAKWVHLDIAGSAWTDKALPYTPRGGTGAMVRTLWALLSDL